MKLKLPLRLVVMLRNHYVHGDHVGSFGMALIHEHFRNAVSFADNECIEFFGELCKTVVMLNDNREKVSSNTDEFDRYIKSIVTIIE